MITIRPSYQFLLSGAWRAYRLLDWILGNICLLKEWSGIVAGCPGEWWSHHPCRCSKNV